MQDKRALRTECRKRLSSLSDEYRRSASNRICSRVISSAAFREARTVFVYLSLPTEPDTLPILQAAWESGKTVCVPRCRPPHDMDAMLLDSLAQTVPGYYGLREPGPCCPAIDPNRIDLVLAPCLAASADGGRLGHGAGYYDRFLPKTQAPVYCLCFGQLLQPAVPADGHDHPMDAIVTEQGIILCKASL